MTPGKRVPQIFLHQRPYRVPVNYASSLSTVEVKDFTRPGEKDSAHGIRCAIKEAIRRGAELVVFEPGRYFLDSTEFFKTEGMTHDKGSPANRNGKDVHSRSFLPPLRSVV